MEINHNVFLMIPAYIADHPEIDDATAMLFGRISKMCEEIGACYATDTELAILSKCRDRVITNRLKKLKNLAFITIITCKKGMISSREIKINEVIKNF